MSGSRNDRVVAVEETPLVRQQSALELLATNLGKSGIGHRCIYCGKVYRYVFLSFLPLDDLLPVPGLALSPPSLPCGCRKELRQTVVV